MRDITASTVWMSLFNSLPFFSETGPPYDVKFTEVRDASLMLHWEAPLYIGADPVIGYYTDICEEGSEEWKQLNKQPIASTHMRVCIEA